MRPLTRVVYLASRCADVFVDANPQPAIDDVRVFCKEKYGMPPEECDALMNEIGQRVTAAIIIEVVASRMRRLCEAESRRRRTAKVISTENNTMLLSGTM